MSRSHTSNVEKLAALLSMALSHSSVRLKELENMPAALRGAARALSLRLRQNNGRSSAHGATRPPSSHLNCEGAPLGQRGGAPLFVDLAGDEMALLIEMVMDLGMNCAEFLQRLHASKPLHSPFSSSKRRM